MRTDELKMMKQFNINESLFKEGINQINYNNKYIRYGMLPSRSQYITIVKEKFDELKELKDRIKVIRNIMSLGIFMTIFQDGQEKKLLTIIMR